MKSIVFTALLIPLFLVACESSKPGAKKVAEGVKEIAVAAGETTEKTVKAAKEEIKPVTDEIKKTLSEAAEKTKAATKAANEKLEEKTQNTK